MNAGGYSFFFVVKFLVAVEDLVAVLGAVGALVEIVSGFPGRRGCRGKLFFLLLVYGMLSLVKGYKILVVVIIIIIIIIIERSGEHVTAGDSSPSLLN